MQISSTLEIPIIGTKFIWSLGQKERIEMEVKSGLGYGQRHELSDQVAVTEVRWRGVQLPERTDPGDGNS